MPTAECFYKPVQFLTRNEGGIISPYVGEIEIIFDEDLTVVATIDTDENGWIEAGVIPSYSGGQFRFKPPSFDTYILMTAGADYDEAYKVNTITSGFVDDDYAQTQEPDFVDIYLEDADNADVRTQKIGSVAPGSAISIPYESAYEKHLKVYAVPQGVSVGQNADEFSNIGSDVLIVPALVAEQPQEPFKYRRYFMFRG